MYACVIACKCVCACVLIIVVSSYPLVWEMHFARKAYDIHSGICCGIDKLLALFGGLYKTHTHAVCIVTVQ